MREATSVRFPWERAVLDAPLGRGLKLVLLSMATYADKHGGNVRPGYDRLARQTGYSVRSVERRIREACDTGWLIKVGGGYRGKSACFRLTVPTTAQHATHDDLPPTAQTDTRVPDRATPVPPKHDTQVADHQTTNTSESRAALTYRPQGLRRPVAATTQQGGQELP